MIRNLLKAAGPAIGFAAALLASASSAEMSATVGGVDVYVTGALQTQIGFGVHREGETDLEPGVDQQGDVAGLHETYTWLDLETEWSWGDHWKARVNPFVMGDLTYVLYDGNQDWRVFEPSRDKLEVDDAPQRILREAYLQYTQDLFQVRVGQQTVGWGESDGLRLLDVINPLDISRQSFLLDEGFRLTRVPQTMLRLIVTPGALMVGSRRLFTSWSFEGIVTPQLEPVRTYLTPDGRYGGHGAASAGGVWAAPPLDWKDRTERLNLPFGTLDGFLPDDQIRANDRQPHYEWTDPLLAARLTGDFPNGRVTINYAQRIGTIMDFPLTRVRSLVVDASQPPFPRPGFANPVTEASLVVDLVYPRKHILGFSMNYDLGDFLVAPGALGATSPVVRVEASYTLGHPFNRAQRVKEDIGFQDIVGFPDVTPVVVPRFLQRKDFLQYMVGVDWPLRVSWLNPRAELFHSLQVFHQKPISPDDRLALQPYKRLTVREDQVFLTYLGFTEYFHRKIVPQVLFGFDANTLAWFTKSKMGHEIGDHWRIEWGILYFDRGRLAPTESIFGLFARRTDAYVRVGYQF